MPPKTFLPAARIARTALLALLFIAPGAAFAWSENGHNAIAAIAEANLAPRAKAAIEKYLDGRSIVFYAEWLDWVRLSPKYKHTSDWHVAQVDRDFKYTSEVAAKGGDAVSAVEQSIKALRDYRTLPDETVAFHIKVLVHLLGDMHCPVHVYYTTIQHKIKISMKGGELTSHHGIWDGHVVDRHGWGYVEWVHQMNRLDREKIAEITAGAPRDWFNQTAQDSRVIYDWVKPNQKLDDAAYREYMVDKAMPLARSQIQKAGYRLAKVLNECFDAR